MHSRRKSSTNRVDGTSLYRYHDCLYDYLERLQTEVDNFMREWLVLYGIFQVVYGRVSQSPTTESTRFRKYECYRGVLFLSTNAMGCIYGRNNPNSKLLPIARWLQQLLLWLYYSDEEVFKDDDANTVINTAQWRRVIVLLWAVGWKTRSLINLVNYFCLLGQKAHLLFNKRCVSVWGSLGKHQITLHAQNFVITTLVIKDGSPWYILKSVGFLSLLHNRR
jgi:hypothetical protein